MDLAINDIGNLLPWLLLLAAYLALSFHSELTDKRVFVLVSLGLLVVFAGLRQPFTPDLERYRSMFDDPDLLSASFIEPSFILIAKTLQALGLDYHALYLVYTAITLTFVYLGINRLTQHTRLALFLYISIPACFLNLFVEMRQVCAIAIAFYATGILLQTDIRHRLLKVWGWAMVSICFHYSALLYWLLLLCFFKLVRRSWPAAVCILAMFVSLAIPTSAVISGFVFLSKPILPAKLLDIVNLFIQSSTSLAESGQILKSAVYIAIGCVFVLRLRSHRDDPRFRVLVNLFVAGVVILNLTRDFAPATRMAYFFLIFQIAIFPEILNEVRQKVWSLLAGYTLVLFYMAQFLWGLFYFSEEAQSYVFLHYRNALFSLFR
ncbi:MAG: EpsG family protein [Acidobacteriota bacterium]